MTRFALTLAAGLVLISAPLRAEPVNPQIDYPAFEQLVRDLGPVREARRLAWDEFAARARSENAILLDARSAGDFNRGHIAGAVNLPFSEFTDERLAAVLGPETNRPIYIYCNNNFSDNIAPIVTKRVALALNIPTFINLHGYGYTNVWELADVVSIADSHTNWVSGG